MNSPIPRAPQAKFYQGSSLRSARDADRPDRMWSRTDSTASTAEAVMRHLSKLQSDLGKIRRRVLGGGGGATTGGVAYLGEYDPGKSYKAFSIVRFTPDGDAAGTYISKIDVPAGVWPDTGGSYWDVFANGPQSIWA